MHDHPPELKGFHEKNMRQAISIFLVPVLAGGLAFYRQEVHEAKDELQTALYWIFMLGVGVFMITILIKATVTLPKCPKCHKQMKQLQTVDIEDESLFSTKSISRWRIVRCSECKCEYRIPGLSTEN